MKLQYLFWYHKFAWRNCCKKQPANLWYQKWYLYVTTNGITGAYNIQNWILYVVGTGNSDSGEVAFPLLVPQVCMMESLQQFKCGAVRCVSSRKNTCEMDAGLTTYRRLLLFGIKCPAQGWNKSPAVHPLLFCQILTISTIHNDVSVRVSSLGLMVGSKIHYDTYHLQHSRYSTRLVASNTLNCSEPLTIKNSMASTYHVMSKILKHNPSLLVGLMKSFWFFMVFLSCIWEVR
jgi:hypothetical protein